MVVARRLDHPGQSDVPDLMRDKFHVWLSKYHWIPLTTLGIVLLVTFGWNAVLWGIFLRVVVGLHCTWLVNSATHLWGSQRFATGDDSRNSFWVALLTFGEGWHNNHHAHAQSARHGLRWWEIDMNWYGIQILRMFGLARDIKLPRLNKKYQEVPNSHEGLGESLGSLRPGSFQPASE